MLNQLKKGDNELGRTGTVVVTAVRTQTHDTVSQKQSGGESAPKPKASTAVDSNGGAPDGDDPSGPNRPRWEPVGQLDDAKEKSRKEEEEKRVLQK